MSKIENLCKHFSHAALPLFWIFPKKYPLAKMERQIYFIFSQISPDFSREIFGKSDLKFF